MKQLVEKYRPKRFDDLIGNSEIIDELKQMVKMKNIPHLLLCGSAGTGKTSAVQVLINEMYGEDVRRRTKEINASDKSGIDNIRTEVKEYATYSTSKNGIDFRMLILEECDEMSKKAQPALRRIMEMFATHCRFILTCNYEFKIIDPIKNRCKVLNFKELQPEDILKRIKYICEQEKINITDEALVYISENSEGNLRTPLNNYLESALVYSSKYPTKKITLEMIKKLKIEDNDGMKILKDSLNSKFIQVRQFTLNKLKLGITSRNLINEVVETAYKLDKIPSLMKSEIALLHAESEVSIISGATDIIILTAFLAKLGHIGSKYLKKKGK